MDKIEALQAIYNAEINFSISTFRDGGFTAKIGDEVNGFVASETFETLAGAMNWITETAPVLYPEIED